MRSQHDRFAVFPDEIPLVKSDFYITDYAGDFYRVEEERGLLETPHPCDPNRLTGHRIGYGWPDVEWPITLLASIFGAKKKNRSMK